ncbi:MAG: PhnD/SsuA/transferrin family substrate-binding protein [Anaerolineales bacterium]|nr:PhnD/SsuA/transferrin family substrate-binding protein [Anaerolineales bacterium]
MNLSLKKVLMILTLAGLACSAPWRMATPSPIPTLTALPNATATPRATPEPGSAQNPLILALSPSAHPADEVIAAGEALAGYLQQRTGYHVVTVVPPSESALISAFEAGNAHLAALTPFGYLLAKKNQSVTAALASARQGQRLYGLQFIVNRDGGFESFYDEASHQNTATLNAALKQFEGKKPCWSDPLSPSGYVLPFGLLNQAGVKTRSGAFLEGQPNVVRAVYAADICDFGATFIDARSSPALEADYPDVLDKVRVVWRSEAFIPYDNISFSVQLPLEMRRVLQRAFVDFMLTPEGKSAIQVIYGFDELQVADDALYADFETYADASKIDLQGLVEKQAP